MWQKHKKRTTKVKILHFPLKTNIVVSRKFLEYLCTSHVLGALYKEIVAYV